MRHVLISTLALMAVCGPVVAQEAAAPAEAAPVAEAAASPGDWRIVAPDNLLVIDTNHGRILVEMSPIAAPGHVERMRLLARRGFFDGLLWHRVIDWFMAQTGDPLGTGDGQSAWPDLVGEFTFRRGADVPYVPVAEPAGASLGFIGSLPVQTQPDAAMALTEDARVHAWGVYCPGVAGMARGDDNDSANSQFFLMRQAYPSLDKRYTAWGAVVSGLEVVRALKTGAPGSGAVTEPDQMTRVRVAADLPDAERPTVRVLDPYSARFRALVTDVRAARGADFSVCDVTLPVEVDLPGA
jgi:peptidylprolyl isomerase